VAQTCNPNYSGDRDKEHGSSMPAQTNSLRAPSSKNKSQKRTGGVGQGVDSEFKPQY
jgi:hypothetical protein